MTESSSERSPGDGRESGDRSPGPPDSGWGIELRAAPGHHRRVLLPQIPLEASAPDLAERISSILGAAEAEADRLLDDAREEAERQVDLARRQADGLLVERQRRIAELSDGVLDRAEAVLGGLEEAQSIREGLERLLRALADAAEGLALETGSASTAGP